MKRKCTYSSRIMFICLVLLGSLTSVKSEEVKEHTLKDALQNKFNIGVAMNLRQIWQQDTLDIRIIKKHFNSIVAENCMKSAMLQPEEGKFVFKDADKFVEFGEQNQMQIIGHTLIWHSQAPRWFFTDKNGKEVSREILVERMKNHITTVVSRYKGRVKGWDVVNEAILDDGSFRNSKFYQIIGEDFIQLAFEFAHAADPNAELYYNDFSMAVPEKRNGVVSMVRKLQAKGVKVDGIGMQGHLGLEHPSIDEFEKSIIAFKSTGAKIMITELDMSVLPFRENVGAEVSANFDYAKDLDPYTKGLPKDVSEKWNKRMSDFFTLFLKYSNAIDRITLWGLSDNDSWKNNWPIQGRTDYPLLFNRQHKAKPVIDSIIKIAGSDLKKDNNMSSVKNAPRYLIPNDYMADPAAHVFEGKLYIYPSHDLESGIEENDNGDHFNMKDYHVFSMQDINGEVTDHGVVLTVEDIPWAGRQLWDSDVAFKNDKYYMYFPLKDRNDIFRIGVAVSGKPYGPFIPQKHPMLGSYSIDPCVFEDNGQHYMYFGGIWGGQLQRYRKNKALESAVIPADGEPSICSKIARLDDNMMEFGEEPRDVVILDENGKPLMQGDTQRRFFEASWMHKYNGKYYFSYSTGDTHNLCYATGDNPYGPFVYQGVIMTPVVGWTTHHSIVEYEGKWYLFYHDSVPSGGKTWLRSMKVVELEYNPDGTIKTLDGMNQPKG